VNTLALVRTHITMTFEMHQNTTRELLCSKLNKKRVDDIRIGGR